MILYVANILMILAFSVENNDNSGSVLMAISSVLYFVASFQYENLKKRIEWLEKKGGGFGA